MQPAFLNIFKIIMEQQTILIPERYELKLVEYNGFVYCVDPNKPNVLRISEDIKTVLVQGQGKSLHDIKKTFSAGDEAIDCILDLKKKGYFQNISKETVLIPKAINKISMVVSAACNFKCLYCYEGDVCKSSQPEYMTWDIAKRGIDLITGKSAEINFFGGEPLLNFHLIKKIVDDCKSKELNINFTVTTNGSLITPEIAKYLFDSGFAVIVSIDGPENVHNKMRRFANGAPSFSATWNGIKILQNTFPAKRLVFSGVLTALYPYPEQLYNALKSMALSRLSLNTVSAPGEKGIDLDEDAIMTVMEGDKAVCEAILSDETFPVTKYLPISQYMRFLIKGERRRTRCDAGIDNVAVAANGKIYLCHRFIGQPQFEMGDVWNNMNYGKQAKMLLRSQSYNECSKCWARNICGGPCMHDSFVYTGALENVVPLKCERIKNLIELAIVAVGELSRKGKDRLLQCL